MLPALKNNVPAGGLLSVPRHLGHRSSVEWLKFAASQAEQVDPLTDLRADIARALAEKTTKTSDASSEAAETSSSTETDEG
jgi:hypothetical protein